MITFEDYLSRLAELWTQFKLARTAIEGWAQSQEALDRYASGELEDLRKIILEGAEAQKKELGSHWVFADEVRINEYRQALQAEASRHLTQVEMRLVQYEYLLLVAVFESFMKSVHREILSRNRKLLRPNRAVELGRLISEGQEAVINREIEREIQSLDRESTERKAVYFRKRLGIDWAFGGAIIPLLDKVITLRNIILHQNPDQVVGDADFKLAVMVCAAVPYAMTASTALLYPDVCSLPAGLLEDQARKIFTPRSP
jgi:hypothetical protein